MPQETVKDWGNYHAYYLIEISSLSILILNILCDTSFFQLKLEENERRESCHVLLLHILSLSLRKLS